MFVLFPTFLISSSLACVLTAWLRPRALLQLVHTMATRRSDPLTNLEAVLRNGMRYRTKPANSLAFERHGKSMRVLKLIAKIKFPEPLRKNTTSACICPGNTVKPEMCAVSGWSDFTTLGLLNGRKYVPLVRQIANLLKVELPASCYDNPANDPNPGSHNSGRVQAVRTFYL